MANEFDQFDAPTVGNPFDKFDRPKSPAARGSEYSPAPENLVPIYAGSKIVGYRDFTNSPMLEAIGAGMTRAGRRIGRIMSEVGAANSDGAITEADVRNDPTTGDQAFKDQTEVDAPLMRQPGAGVGRVVGEATPTFAVGGAPRALTQLAGSTAARTLGPVLRNALARIGTGGVEGAVQGTIAADPEDRKESAGFGAVVGGALPVVGSALGRTMKGLATKSPENDFLRTYADQHGKDVFVPLVQATHDADATSQVTRAVFRNALPWAIGVEGRIAKQSKKLQEDLRTLALKEADFKGVLPENAGAEVRSSIDALQKASDEAFNTSVKSYSFQIPSSTSDDVKDMILGVAPNTPKGIIKTVQDELASVFKKWGKKNSNGVYELPGENLLKAKNDFQEIVNSTPRTTKDVYWETQKIFDKIAEEGLDVSIPQQQADLELYKQAKSAWTQLTTVKKAMKRAESRGGTFSMSDLSGAAGGRDRIIGSMADVAQDVTGTKATRAVLGGDPSKYMAAALGGYVHLPATLALTGAAHGLATPSAQRFAMGDTSLQRAIINLLRKNPSLAPMAENAMRTSAVEGYTP